MLVRTLAATAAMSALSLGFAVLPAEAAPPARTFKNCTELNKVYKHGVGKPGARDRSSGKSVSTFVRSLALYNANAKSDRDKDGVACEKA
ncbi:excalibur calcium-binding domain-containing protein [Nocardioides houyundeii]|uniref:excalibur calcium-binding domain-containing protein n=1 Tax=Nocardioides houyundeii TaxID=2045452 RepID=UPI000C78FCDB|nr:excalibur calcium-binding domain-containing protein [Nocardioides houyundeii]